jgi:glycosyltransferase involved in cell wall biosynthesis
VSPGRAAAGSPRTVLYLAWAPFFSGAERALLLTVQHLDPARYRPHVILGTSGETLAAFRAAGVSCEVVSIARLDKRHPLRWAASVARVARIGRRVQAAIVHSNDAPSFQPGGFAGRVLGIPAVTHIRFPDTTAGFAWFLRPAPSRVFFVSEHLRADAIAQSRDLFEDRSDVVYDAVALPDPISDEARVELRRSLGLLDDRVVVGLTGQVAEIKGIWEFLDAAHLLVGKGVEATFAVLGDDLKGHGALRRAMEQRVAALDLASHFRFLGFRPDAPRLIPAFDVITVPSHIEPLGSATLEAMAAGRPVVGSRVGAIPEMVVEGETGVLVPAQDPDALAKALEPLIASPEQRQRLGRVARERAKRTFSLGVHAARLQAVYDSLLGGRA